MSTPQRSLLGRSSTAIGSSVPVCKMSSSYNCDQGVADMVYDFPVEEGKIDADLGVSEVRVQKAQLKTFVEQNNLRVGQPVETFTQERTAGPKFIIRAVNPENDSVILRLSFTCLIFSAGIFSLINKTRLVLADDCH